MFNISSPPTFLLSTSLILSGLIVTSSISKEICTVLQKENGIHFTQSSLQNAETFMSF